MLPRKRGRAEMESPAPAPVSSLLLQLRNTWEFANLMQYIYIFGKVVRIDEDFDIEDLEAECLKVEPSEKLSEIGLALLKFVSSHRGLTPDLFDEYTRRQYVAKAPSRNPFGTEEEPKKFANFDIFTKLRVLFQLSQWTLINADRIREKMPETKDTEQTIWRVEEMGYDRDECLYFVLDDNRLYRRTDPALPAPSPPKPKAKSKKGRAAARASKRRKVVETDKAINGTEGSPEPKTSDEVEATENLAAEDDSFGGRKWECIAVTLDEYQDFLESIRKSKDLNEKALFTRLTKDVLPVIEKAAENQQKKIAKRERELMNLQKLATAKRSSRIASKQDREREEQEAREAELRRQNDLIAAKKDLERQKQMEEARESRMMTREQRLKEREYKRLLHEEELANLSEDSKKLETGEARMSERHLRAEMEKRKKELEKLAQEDQWVFDCLKCGVHGENLDDGSHSVACETCNVWQHSACLGISQADAEKNDFHFICSDCKRRDEDSKKPKIPALKFRLGSSSSPPSDKTIFLNSTTGESRKRPSSDFEDGFERLPPMKKFRHVSNMASNRGVEDSPVGMHDSIMNGPTLSPHGQVLQENSGSGHSPPPGLASPTRPSHSNGYGHHTSTAKGYPSQNRYRSNSIDNDADQIILDSSGSMSADRKSSHHSPQTSQGNHELLKFSHSSSSNPFLHSFDRQQPSSPSSTHNPPSPMKNRPSMSPTQGNPDITPLAFSKAINTNGHLITSRPSATHPSAYNNLSKLNSSPPPSSLLNSSSPIMPPPTQQSRTPSSGLSPSKNSPPRPASSNGVSGTPVMPPAANLEPSPQMPNLNVPVKGLGPEQIRTTAQVNGHIFG